MIKIIRQFALVPLQVCATAFLLATFLPSQANADNNCATVYSGCAICAYATYTFVPSIGGLVFVSGGSQLCTSSSNTPNLSATITAFDPVYGLFSAECSTITPLPTTGQSCIAQPSDPNVQNVYRFYTYQGGPYHDHFLTLNYSEGVNAARYNYEGVAFVTYKTPIDSDMQPLYSCWYTDSGGGGGHFTLLDANCGGFTNEGTLGYVSTISRAGFTPLYYFWQSASYDHLTITNYSEGANNGFGYYGTQGYVPVQD